MKRGFLKTRRGKEILSIDTLRARVNANKDGKDVSTIVHHLLPLNPGTEEDEQLWKASQFTEDAPSDKLDYEPHELVCTTQPAQLNSATRETNPDGWSECLVSGLMKQTILKTPSFPQPLSHPDRIRHRVSSGTSNKPLPGLYATETLELGDLVLSERPVLVVPAMVRTGVIFHDHLTPQQMNEIAMAQWNKTLKVAFSRLSKEDQEAFWKLRDVFQKNGKKKMYGVVRTNGFRVQGLDDPGLENNYGHIADCRPNVERCWDMASFSMQLRAMRKITRDEELTVSFIDQLQPYATRKVELEKFDIVCSCPSCKKPKLGDKRRAQFEQGTVRAAEIVDWVKDISLSDDHLIKRALVQISLLEADGLENSPYYEENLLAIMIVYITLGDAVKAERWGRKLGTWKMCRYGPQAAEEYKSPERYTKHELWKVRVDANNSYRATVMAINEKKKQG
ncbi:hypothetical protein BT96DRAFT_997217 [Gymnopus androsaceus JB14]|uniref:SET domain-containing protein n=1 Tax=Gymnopus androsaceus JB14 TaxID=1447944 RepID=A0A6A4HCB6_9AGAR|nr:hypothetical protein BT96DRAFT_997217 [Gymnopus androsaceus JB14]